MVCFLYSLYSSLIGFQLFQVKLMNLVQLNYSKSFLLLQFAQKADIQLPVKSDY